LKKLKEMLILSKNMKMGLIIDLDRLIKLLY